MADISILDKAATSVPKQYKIAGAQEIVLKGVTASFNGSGAGGSWVPAVKVIDPSGFVVGTYTLGASLAAGVSADVSWFPGVGTNTGAGGSGIQFDTDNEGGWLDITTNNTDPNGAGMQLIDKSGGSIYVIAEHASQLFLDSDNGIELSDNSASNGLRIVQENDGGITLLDQGAGGIFANVVGNGGFGVENDGSGDILIQQAGPGNAIMRGDGNGNIEMLGTSNGASSGFVQMVQDDGSHLGFIRLWPQARGAAFGVGCQIVPSGGATVIGTGQGGTTVPIGEQGTDVCNWLALQTYNSEPNTTLPTANVGCKLYCYTPDAGVTNELRVKFTNGTVVTLATD
jgi:hypothetical protein